MEKQMKNQLFKKVELPQKKDRTYFYTSFVSTIDGKIFVKKPGYWPIGSTTDYEYFTWLRAHADAILDGKGTAIAFGDKTIETIHKPEFKALREKAGKTTPAHYLILTNERGYLQKELQITLQKFNFQPQFIPSTTALASLAQELFEQGYKHVFIDGGPTLLRSFIEAGLLDEIFLTLAPKVFGNEADQTITMVEGGLFKPQEVPEWNLYSNKTVGDEVFLRYRKRK
jgi:5-amino-6-(5-phosphoribosylamino)uracil reductase